jgi:histone H3/H4
MEEDFSNLNEYEKQILYENVMLACKHAGRKRPNNSDYKLAYKLSNLRRLGG